jgi:hypothetical protein
MQHRLDTNDSEVFSRADWQQSGEQPPSPSTCGVVAASELAAKIMRKMISSKRLTMDSLVL